MNPIVRDITGYRGERIVELRLTDFSAFPQPLFRPAFLSDKWPTIDFYVELLGVEQGHYLFGQSKATRRKITSRSVALQVQVTAAHVRRLRHFNGPTYVFGVHEPSQKVYVKAICARTPDRSIATIPLANELTPANLRRLHDEVKAFWGSSPGKPKTSVFA